MVGEITVNIILCRISGFRNWTVESSCFSIRALALGNSDRSQAGVWKHFKASWRGGFECTVEGCRPYGLGAVFMTYGLGGILYYIDIGYTSGIQESESSFLLQACIQTKTSGAQI